MVYSVKGRDKGNCYVCVAVENESFVLISDGKLHKLGKPKKKNIIGIRLLPLLVGI